MNPEKFKKLLNCRRTGWYDVKDGPETARLEIFGPVGGGWFGDGVTAQAFCNAVKAASAPVLELHINSAGGSVTDGLTIYNTLNADPRRVRVVVDGIAASIASVIAMAGDEIAMAENSLMIVHQPWDLVCGNAKAMRREADDLDKISAQITKIYQDRTGLSAEEVTALLDGEDDGTLLTAAEAKEKGFATELLANKTAAACFGADIWTGVPADLVAADEPAPEPAPAPAPAPEPAPEPAPAPADDTAERLNTLEAANAQMKIQLEKLLGNALAPQPENGAVLTWAQALEAAGGYAKARQLYPLAYEDFMKSHTQTRK